MKRVLCLIFVLLLLIPGCSSAKILSNGSKGTAVVELQQRLKALGMSISNADGIFGAKTVNAVKEAQRVLKEAGYEIEVTGKADDAFQALLQDPEAETVLKTLRPGSKGKRVTSLQKKLIELNLLEGKADGHYGEETRQAVEAFQSTMIGLGAEDLEADGIAVPEVYDLLMSDLTEWHYPSPLFYQEGEPLSLTDGQLYAKAAILLDAPSGEVLLARNADEKMYPASTTKMMTLLLAVEQGNLDRRIKIPKAAENVPDGSSLVPVRAGETMSMKDLLYGLILRSGNDAANAVAVLCAGEIDEFVRQMNAKAWSLGMKGTHFSNPHGFHDPNHYTTAGDLAKLARAGLTNPTFCEIVTCLSYTLPKTEKRKSKTIENTYEIFNPSSSYYISGAAGVKSGYTSQAGFCYVGAAQRNGKTLIAVVMDESSKENAWTDLKRMFEYGFAKEK